MKRNIWVLEKKSWVGAVPQPYLEYRFAWQVHKTSIYTDDVCRETLTQMLQNKDKMGPSKTLSAWQERIQLKFSLNLPGCGNNTSLRSQFLTAHVKDKNTQVQWNLKKTLWPIMLSNQMKVTRFFQDAFWRKKKGGGGESTSSVTPETLPIQNYVIMPVLSVSVESLWFQG